MGMGGLGGEGWSWKAVQTTHSVFVVRTGERVERAAAGYDYNYYDNEKKESGGVDRLRRDSTADLNLHQGLRVTLGEKGLEFQWMAVAAAAAAAAHLGEAAASLEATAASPTLNHPN